MGTWRLILAWLVIANHTNGYRDLFAIDIGAVAVATFFFISGFLMPLAYKTNYSKNGFIEGCRRFYINRFLRIYPIYWVSCALILFGKFLVGSGLLRGHTLDPEVSLITYFQNFLLIGLNQSNFWGGYIRFNNPAWSLDVELQYYLLVPLLFWMASRYSSALTNILIMLSAISVYLFFYTTGLVDIDRSFLAWAFFFVLGFVFEASVFWQAFFSRFKVVTFIVVTLLVATLVLNQRYTNLGTFLVIIGFVVVSAFLLVKQKEYKYGHFDRLVGDLSYPTYILHFLLLGITANYLSAHLSLGLIPKFAVTVLINILGSILMAYVSLRVISDPIDRVRVRIRGLK